MNIQDLSNEDNIELDKDFTLGGNEYKRNSNLVKDNSINLNDYSFNNYKKSKNNNTNYDLLSPDDNE